ncbi:hypothetical protein GCM10017783_13790 [Deinococcus piscis]|uniref:Uncharacterized protein n=1 Tax=Deinococcus piscis TaxID=394230 RepID=A0ABQ3K4G9_9DEIO|nr:hypothetical protein GCM10017783_13790 [Deinococcus piscis]
MTEMLAESVMAAGSMVGISALFMTISESGLLPAEVAEAVGAEVAAPDEEAAEDVPAPVPAFSGAHAPKANATVNTRGIAFPILTPLGIHRTGLLSGCKSMPQPYLTAARVKEHRASTERTPGATTEALERASKLLDDSAWSGVST